jgi:hypothetical protein
MLKFPWFKRTPSPAPVAIVVEPPKAAEPRAPLVIEPPAPPVERFDPSGLMNRYMERRG